MSERAVIHKQVIELKGNFIPEKEYRFEVPIDADMVDMQWDPVNYISIAFWYKTLLPPANIGGQEVKLWKMIVRDTGETFPKECTHLATVVRDGIALHVLDADGSNITWSEL